MQSPHTKKILSGLYLALIAFLTYACVYAFRKPFTIAAFNGIEYGGISYKTQLIISQATGYLLSKFTGIKLIAELQHRYRRLIFLILIFVAWGALFFLGVVPFPYGNLCLFINGYCLGFTWGIVFSYVEGRKLTDMIGAVMAVSFIFSGGVTRSVAIALQSYWKLDQQWVAFFTGLVFTIPIVILIFLLDKVPRPDEEDVKERIIRVPMYHSQRKNFLKKFGIGLILIVISYVLLTVMRDIRDNYMVTIWDELGYGSSPLLVSGTETFTSICVLLLMSFIVVVHDHYRAYVLIHWIIILGFVLSVCACIFFSLHWISGAVWMQLIGLGLYAGYIPFNCILFERFISAFHVEGNVGFLMYYADAYGYLGSLLVMITKEWISLPITWVDFYIYIVVTVSIIGIITTITSVRFFTNKYKLSFQ
jgi:hypothetical protein